MIVNYSVLDTPISEGGYGHMEDVDIPAPTIGPMCLERFVYGCCFHHSCGMTYSSQRIQHWDIHDVMHTIMKRADLHRTDYYNWNLCNHPIGEYCDGNH